MASIVAYNGNLEVDWRNILVYVLYVDFSSL
jgi:hypothetical protein